MTTDQRGPSAVAPHPPWLSEEQQHQWRGLVALLMTLPPALDAQLKRDAGINAFEYQVLAALSGASERTLVLTELASAARGSLSRLSHAITRLERSGWVTRSSCSDGSGRRTQARLTDDGLAKLQDTAAGHVQEVRRLVVDVLTPQQLAALGEAARAIAAAADPSRGCAGIGQC